MAPDLSFANERIRPEWMLAFMQNPHAFIPDASMPYMALSSEEAQAIRLYISKLKAQKKIEAAPLPKSTPTQVPERIHK